MTRDFVEERRFQLIREEMNRIKDRALGPKGTPQRDEIDALYAQNPLLNMLMNGRARDVAAYRQRFLAEQERLGNIKKTEP